jgi:hypothetical protein
MGFFWTGAGGVHALLRYADAAEQHGLKRAQRSCRSRARRSRVARDGKAISGGPWRPRGFSTNSFSASHPDGRQTSGRSRATAAESSRLPRADDLDVNPSKSLCKTNVLCRPSGAAPFCNPMGWTSRLRCTGKMRRLTGRLSLWIIYNHGAKTLAAPLIGRTPSAGGAHNGTACFLRPGCLCWNGAGGQFLQHSPTRS